MDGWGPLISELPGRLQALSDVCFWLFTGVWLLFAANLVQYRQRRRADKELAKVHSEWREHASKMQTEMNDRLADAQAMLVAEIHASEKRSEKRLSENWTLNAKLQKQKSDAGKLD